MKDYYIFKSGRLKRKDNSIVLETSNEDITIPINDIESLLVFGEVDINTKALNFLAKNKILVHFFDYYGWYKGTLYPKEYLVSGYLLVKQVEHVIDEDKRLYIAKQFVKSAFHGMIYNLKRYPKVDENIIKKIEYLSNQIESQKSIQSLMGTEGNGKELYYSAFQYIFSEKVEFKKRVRRPPDNMVNTLISYINSLIYTSVIKEIYHTQLNPTIGYLHEPADRRFSLALDVAEIFKPIYGDRIMFDLINNGSISENYFDKELNYCYLKENGQKIVIKEYEDKLNTTIYHRTLDKRVSYKHIIRLELYKLIKHLIGEMEYEAFKLWW